ncbi:alginate biosynthesis protein [Billgrantia antri]|uniref:Alginate biosynthesis protein n=1 Tax=Halomonas sulfidivorans TaxID=2733488 RepID=A0ABX7WF90_9GAMM|nr:alginate biosynthesis protein [Halomonas sulfidivorans]QTP58515.1 alginate biosynthesis protein [Halomonas sulfidivorans]
MSTTHLASGITADELETLVEDADAGDVFVFADGEYRFDDAITLTRSDVTLRGAGSERTTLRFSDAALASNDAHAIRVEPDTYDRELGQLETDLSAGGRSVTLASTEGLAAGDTLRIWQDNDTAFLDEIGDTSWRKQQHAELRTSMAKVEAVDGNRVTLDRGAHFDFAAHDARAERVDSVDNISLEGLGLAFDLGSPDNADFSNVESELNGYQAVSLDGTVNARLDDVSVVDGPSTAFHFSRALDIEAQDISARGSFNKGSGGNGYAYELKESYDGSLQGLEDSGMRHGLLFASWRSSVGNDVEVNFTDRDINFHGGRDHDNLVRVAQSIRDSDADELSPALWVNAGGESFGAITDLDANEVRFDYLVGTRRDDAVQGSDDGVYLNGGLGHDELLGGAGHDILQGGVGDDWYDGTNRLDGGAGIDIARYTQPLDRHRLEFEGDTVRLRSDKDADDTLIDMEYAVFGDGRTLHIPTRRVFEGEALETPSPEAILADEHLPGGLVDDGTELAVNAGTTTRWDDGYVSEVFVENVGDETIEDLVLRLAPEDEVDKLWNAHAEHVGDDILVRDDTPSSLAPGESWRFAYRAQGETPESIGSVQADSSGGELDVQVLGVEAPRYDELVG